MTLCFGKKKTQNATSKRGENEKDAAAAGMPCSPSSLHLGTTILPKLLHTARFNETEIK